MCTCKEVLGLAPAMGRLADGRSWPSSQRHRCGCQTTNAQTHKSILQIVCESEDDEVFQIEHGSIQNSEAKTIGDLLTSTWSRQQVESFSQAKYSAVARRADAIENSTKCSKLPTKTKKSVRAQQQGLKFQGRSANAAKQGRQPRRNPGTATLPP